MNRLSLMSGVHHPEGWVTLDANPANTPHILATIPPLPIGVTSVRWDLIEWIHGITSLYPWEAEQVLKELRGVLAPGGVLVLEQVDFRFASDCGAVEWIFGDPRQRDPHIMNKWAYTPTDLIRLLYKCGLTVASFQKAQHHMPDRDFRIEARV